MHHNITPPLQSKTNTPNAAKCDNNNCSCNRGLDAPCKLQTVSYIVQISIPQEPLLHYGETHGGFCHVRITLSEVVRTARTMI